MKLHTSAFHLVAQISKELTGGITYTLKEERKIKRTSDRGIAEMTSSKSHSQNSKIQRIRMTDGNLTPFCYLTVRAAQMVHDLPPLADAAVFRLHSSVGHEGLQADRFRVRASMWSFLFPARHGWSCSFCATRICES